MRLLAAILYLKCSLLAIGKLLRANHRVHACKSKLIDKNVLYIYVTVWYYIH